MYTTAILAYKPKQIIPAGDNFNRDMLLCNNIREKINCFVRDEYAMCKISTYDRENMTGWCHRNAWNMRGDTE